ncbi:ParB/RepB/Spo0J family partition protein [Vibrio cholerae]
MALAKSAIKGQKAAEKNLTQPTVETKKPLVEFAMLPVNKIHPDPEQPRKAWEEEDKNGLKSSIQTTKGCKSPVMVRPHPEKLGEFMLVYGEGRWLCHSELGQGFELIPALIEIDPNAEQGGDYDRYFVQVAENVSRYKMKAIYEAESFHNLMEKHRAQTGKKLNQDSLAKMLGLNRTTVSRTLSILKAPDVVKALSIDGVTQSTNALAYLEQISREVSETELLRIIDEFKTGELTEHDLQKLITELKHPEKKQPPQNELNNMIERQMDLDDAAEHGNFDSYGSETSDEHDHDEDAPPPKSKEKDYGFYDYKDIYEKALFDVLMKVDAAFSISEDQKNEMAQSLVDVTKELVNEKPIVKLLGILVSRLPKHCNSDANEVMKTLFNQRLLRKFYREQLLSSCDEDESYPLTLDIKSFSLTESNELIIDVEDTEQSIMIVESDLREIYEALKAKFE